MSAFASLVIMKAVVNKSTISHNVPRSNMKVIQNMLRTVCEHKGKDEWKNYQKYQYY